MTKNQDEWILYARQRKQQEKNRIMLNAVMDQSEHFWLDFEHGGV